MQRWIVIVGLVIGGRAVAQPSEPSGSDAPVLEPTQTTPALSPPSMTPVQPSPMAPPPPMGMIPLGAVRGPRPAEPPLSGPRVIGEAAAGLGAGLTGATLGGLIGFGIECGGGGCLDGEDFPGLTGFLVGAGVGYVTGMTLGVWGVGRLGSQDGSFGATLGGAVLGLGAGIAIEAGLYDTSSRSLGNFLLVATPCAGALIGFNLTRGWRDDGLPIMNSFARLDGGHWRGGLPIVATGPTGTFLSVASGSF